MPGLDQLNAVFSAFAEHLRNRVPVRSVDIMTKTFDPTYGERDEHIHIEVIDLQQLCDEIDAFAERLRNGTWTY